MSRPNQIITVNLNTAIDRVLEVPQMEIGAHAKGRQISRYPAGKAINVSRALARLKCDSIATGFVGQGEALQFEQFLRSTGPGRIICQLLSVRGQTRENITLIDPVLHTDTHIRDEGFEITDADFHRMMSKLGLLARPNTVMVFSGSLPRGMDVARINMLLMMAMSGGAKVVLDMGGDMLSQLIGLDASSGGESPVDAAAGDVVDVSNVEAAVELEDNPLWMVKPNQHELAQMLGMSELKDDKQIVEAALKLARRVRHVVVTMGEAGAWLVQGDQVWRGTVEMDPDRVVNTVGCGDSMLAGLLEGYICHQALAEELSDNSDPGEPLAAILRRGLAAATANALWAGIAEFDLAQVQEIEKLVRVERYEPAGR